MIARWPGNPIGPNRRWRLAHLLGALYNEQLDHSDARVDLGEEQLFDIWGRPREDFVPVLHIGREEARANRTV